MKKQCAHCMREMRGYASAGNGQRLCHPDAGLDCYRLVTVYGHEMPCWCCVDVRVLEDAGRREWAGLR